MVRLNLGTEEASKMIAVGANWDSILTLEAHRVFKEYTEKFSHSTNSRKENISRLISSSKGPV